MTAIASSEQVVIKLRQVFVPDGWNLRTDDPKVQEIADSLKERGQLEPVIVRPGGPSAEQPYIAVAGFRRLAAFRANRWHDRDLLAVVRTYPKGNPLAPIGDNWAENMDREDISPIDKARRVQQLLAGTYPVGEGEEAVRLSVAEVAKLLSLSEREVQKLSRVARTLEGVVADAASKYAAPSWLVVTMSQVPAEGSTNVEKEASRQIAQFKLLDQWRQEKVDLEAQGRKRAERSDRGKKKGKKGGKAEPKPALALSAPVGKSEKARTAADYAECLTFTIIAGANDHIERLEGALEAIRVLAGESKGFSFLYERDWKAFEKSKAVAEAVDEEETE